MSETISVTAGMRNTYVADGVVVELDRTPLIDALLEGGVLVRVNKDGSVRGGRKQEQVNAAAPSPAPVVPSTPGAVPSGAAAASGSEPPTPSSEPAAARRGAARKPRG